MEHELPPDYYSPVHRSLIEPNLLWGVPHKAATVLWTTTLSVAFGAGEYWALLVGVCVHLIVAALTEIDPEFLPVFREALKAPSRWEP